MTQYIDKAAVVAEIDSIAEDAICQYISDKSRYAEGVLDVIHRIKHLLNTLEETDIDVIKRNWYNQGYLRGRRGANISARELGLPSELNTLETKEVNLEEKVDKKLEEYDWEFNKIDFYEFAQYFFELGLKAQKGD